MLKMGLEFFSDGLDFFRKHTKKSLLASLETRDPKIRSNSECACSKPKVSLVVVHLTFLLYVDPLRSNFKCIFIADGRRLFITMRRMFLWLNW